MAAFFEGLMDAEEGSAVLKQVLGGIWPGRSLSALAADASWFVVSCWDPQGWMVMSYAHCLQPALLVVCRPSNLAENE